MRLAILSVAALFFVACSEQPTALSPDPELGPDFARGGIPGPPQEIILPRRVGPPPLVRGRLPPGAGPPSFLADIVVVGAGGNSSCALRSDGAAFCWGSNVRGELGDGTTTPSAAPVPVSGNHTFDQLIVGFRNACGITATGSAHCWGDNRFGQLGAGLPTGSRQFSSIPVPVSGGHSFNNLSVGLVNVCGVADGVTYCWGHNGFGQLGNGTIGDPSNVPVAVSNSANLGFVTVDNGLRAGCALDGAGAVFCWGRDDMFGNGSGAGSLSPVPTAAASGMTLATIEVGTRYVCGLDGGSAAFCWGFDNRVGHQGIGSFVPVLTPTAVVGDLNFASLDTDDNNLINEKQTCGVTKSNEAWCWGGNRFGQLGGPTTETCTHPRNGSFDCSSSPVAVSGNIQFVSIAGGDTHTCGMALDGSVFCWGRNHRGQLGDGTMDDSPVPVAVLGLF